MKYVYKARVLSVHDGDTLHLEVDLNRRVRVLDADLGFSTYIRSGNLLVHEDVRLYGINAPELATPEGRAAFEYFDSLLRSDEDVYVPLVVQTLKQAGHEKQEKYGRWLAWLWHWPAPRPLDTSKSLNQTMIDSGHAVPFMI